MKGRVLALTVAMLLVTAGAASAVTLANIWDIQQMVYPENTIVRVDTVLVTGVDYATTTFGFWAQQKSGGPYGGIQVYTGSTNCGAPNAVSGPLRVGHVVTIDSMRYLEYPSGVHDSLSGSELIYSPQWWTIVDSVTSILPQDITCTDLGMRPYNYAYSEPWEGSLVRLNDVVCVAWDPSFASSYFLRQNSPSGPGDTVTVYVRNNKLMNPGPGRPNIGDVLTSITGLGHFESSRYQLCPRNTDDIVPSSVPPPNVGLAYATSNTGVNVIFDSRLEKSTAETATNYYLGSGVSVVSATLDPVGEQLVSLVTGLQTGGTVEALTVGGVKSKGGPAMPEPQSYPFRGGLTPISMVQAVKSAVNDSSQLTTEQVTVAGIVTANRAPYITHLYVEETPGGPWQGVQIYGGTPAEPVVGDSIIISGYVSEYFFKTELTGIDYLKICSSGNPLPGPNLVDPALIKTGAPTAESYEGVFIRCNPVFIADSIGFDQFGEWRVADIFGTPYDTVMVGHNGNYTYIPVPGTWMNICGPMDYIYSNFRIEPRSDADIDLVNVTGVEPVTPAAPVFALEQNFPNPFNPITTVMFSLPTKGEVDLGVYDVSGRLVKTLYSGVLDQGKHKATWDGSNNAGHAVSSGVYFCKLITKDRVAETKMVILK